MESLVESFLKGGILMWPILACSILSLAIIIERFYFLRASHVIHNGEIRKLLDALRRGDTVTADAIGKASSTLVGRAVARGIDETRTTPVAPDMALINAAQRELGVMWDFMIPLNMLGRVAILLGLLGTVVGMVMGFNALSESGAGQEVIADAIAIALITTVAGMCVAIPATIGEACIRSRIRHITSQCEAVLVEIVKAMKVGNLIRGA